MLIGRPRPDLPAGYHWNSDFRHPGARGATSYSGRIKAKIATGLSHQRHYTIKTSPEFMILKSRLTEEIRVEALQAQH